jgi:hypothetical protein
MNDKQYFEVTEDHLTLLRNANVGWDGCEFGAPSIDCKRPYGNSAVYGDMVRLLEWGGDGEYEAFTEHQQHELDRIHKETATALQIILAVGYFKAGRYEADKYRRNWREGEE